jgi:ATP-dependent RNA helicase RhlE
MKKISLLKKRDLSSSSRNKFRSFRKDDPFKKRNKNDRSSFTRKSNTRNSSKKEKIDLSKLVYKSEKITKEKEYKPKNSFQNFGLPEKVVSNLKNRDFIYPTEIQDIIIPHGMSGSDVVGLSETGSGKTIAFLLPLINKVFKDKKEKVVILAPTRELAQQINKELRECSHGMYLYSTVCVGGMPISRQIQDLNRSQHFVIGTPGRLKDLEDRGVINFSEFSSIVLDEVDRMLDMGFVNEITQILKKIPEKRQVFFFSATMPPKIKTLSETFLKNPKVVNLSTGISTKNVNQDIVFFKSKEERFSKLMDLLNEKDVSKTIVFAETKSMVDELTDELSSYKYKVGLIHGDRRQRDRERTLNSFKEGHIDILVATDVAARGIDVKEVSQVINYTIPQTYDDYIHRIGRTGRAGNFGKAFTFVKK